MIIIMPNVVIMDLGHQARGHEEERRRGVHDDGRPNKCMCVDNVRLS